jgi:hypothetical protein
MLMLNGRKIHYDYCFQETNEMKLNLHIYEIETI